MEENELVQAVKSQVDPLKTQVSEYKSAAEAKIEKVNTDINTYVKSLEEQIKAKAPAESIDELHTQLKGAGDKFDELYKKLEDQGVDLKSFATRLNEAETIPGGKLNQNRVKSMQEQLNDAFEVAQKGGFLAETNKQKFYHELKDGHFGIQSKAVGTFTNANLIDGYANRQISQTVVRTPQNRTHIRQLLNINTMNAAILEYPQETGGEGTPGYQLNEGDAKPQVDYDLQMVPVKAATIAAWMRVSRQSLQDINWLSGYASRRMTEDLLSFEDTQILYGAGGTNQLSGIIPTATAFTKTEAGYATLFEFLVDMVAQQETLNYYTNGILLHPRDYARLLIYKTSTGEFNFPGLVFGGDNRATLMFMGIPIYKSNRIARLTALIGEWDYAELLVREGINFDISYEDANNFTTNLVTLRIEERVALAKYRPAAWMKANLATIYS